MSPLKLPKLPDRETTKLSFAASADLKRQLDAYAALYTKEYGRKEALADLIPYMLEAFLASDREFQKALRVHRDQHDTNRPIAASKSSIQSG
ncbi:MAG: DUF2274 domain-containing protein [Phyllobacteriaceae bacterium]|jgi:hypothetical protein|nr:DUF2274 domain-containing protein [Phyllobacteriaceae bacterium]